VADTTATAPAFCELKIVLTFAILCTRADTAASKGKIPPAAFETKADKMKTMVLALVALSTLTACGGGGATNYTTRGAFAPKQLYATGPLQSACKSQGRKAASSTRCGCIQAVANQQLSSSEQKRGVKAFKDPHKMQEWRQSDRASDNAFWDTWKAFGQSASRVCS
jgi:hypothetical protein